jgi:hypothetical protein
MIALAAGGRYSGGTGKPWQWRRPTCGSRIRLSPLFTQKIDHSLSFSINGEQTCETQGFSRPAGADLATGMGRIVAAAVLMLGESATEGLIAAFEEHVLPELRHHSARIAYLVTELRRPKSQALTIWEC